MVLHLVKENLDPYDFDKVLNAYAPAMEACERAIKENLFSDVPMVTQVAEHLVMSGGKRLRPLLVVLAADLCGYQGLRTATFGTVLEYIHTATLLHDDVIDHAQLRRGRSSCNAIWDNKSSVLVGDFLYCRASSLIAQDGDIQVLAAITHATTYTTEGEILEVLKSRDLSLTQEEYFKIIEFKTAILMSCATEVGAIIGRASRKEQEALRQFGLNLGISFQVADDALDYNSEESEFGKANGVDLKEGKLTLPVLLALKRCDDKERKVIKSGLMSNRDGHFAKVLEILNKYGALQETLQLAQTRAELAKAQLAVFPDSKPKEMLMALTDYVVARNK